MPYLLHDLHFASPTPTFLFCDNLGTTYMATNPLLHARTKHIELDYYFVCEGDKLGTHKVHFMPSVDQPADLLTNGLSKQRFLLLRSKLLAFRPVSLRGDVKHEV